MIDGTSAADPLLQDLAREFGVATEFWDWRGERVETSAATLHAVLGALGVDTSSPAALADALRRRRAERDAAPLPAYAVARAGHRRALELAAAPGTVAHLELEDGGRRSLAPARPGGTIRDAEDGPARRVLLDLPADLPVGYHRLVLHDDGDSACLLFVAPARLGLPDRIANAKVWGLMTQLYSVRSSGSWGVGDLADLADLTAWSGGDHGADFVLVNPLHAAEPVPPMDPSPYLPATRRFANPLYLRVQQVPEFALLPAADRQAIEQLAAATDNDSEQIDRDACWSVKRAALQLVQRSGRSAGREAAFRAFCRREGGDLDDFAAWCVLVEHHGPDWHAWPAPLRHPGSDEVSAFRREHEDELDLHRWLQWQLDEQLAAAQATARRCGMELGIVHDLAVGVSTTGADSWARQDDLARDMTVGAPPDAYAQTGQDWEQPPWRPDRLAALGYRPVRDLVRAVLRHAGGLRVDHIIGLSRLWWIPAGMSATEGTYVRYDHEAYVAILMIEAHRAGAVVIGEDLGTVEPWIRRYLRERGIFGTAVLWFERDWDGGGAPVPPEDWRELCLASVTTHDLPPSAGYLAGDHIRLRHELGLLTGALDEELAADKADQDAWLTLLRARGLLAPGADVAATVRALHRALGATPSLLRAVALTDAVGERRAQNQPGTRDGYPNWRVPLAGPDGRVVRLEDVMADERVAELLRVMREGTAP